LHIGKGELKQQAVLWVKVLQNWWVIEDPLI
jgi:hypothetical protein